MFADGVYEEILGRLYLIYFNNGCLQNLGKVYSV